MFNAKHARVAFTLLSCLGAGLATGSLQAAGEIAPELLKRTADGSPLRVFVLLRDQPQREIMEQVEARSQFRLKAAETDYRRAADLGEMQFWAFQAPAGGGIDPCGQRGRRPVPKAVLWCAVA